MLARLDQLQRGAREPPSRRRGYDTHDVYARYDAYETEPNYYDGDDIYGDENAYPAEFQGTHPCINLMM
jgi:hypothetical protein